MEKNKGKKNEVSLMKVKEEENLQNNFEKSSELFFKESNEGWEEDDLQIDLNNIENVSKKQLIKKNEDIYEEINKTEKSLPDNKYNNKFTKLFDVNSYNIINPKQKEENEQNLLNKSSQNNKRYSF